MEASEVMDHSKEESSQWKSIALLFTVQYRIKDLHTTHSTEVEEQL